MPTWNTECLEQYCMNKTAKYTITTLAAAAMPLYAGELSPATSESVVNEPSAVKKYIDFSLNARLRYEFREDDPLDPSHSGTIRLRPGITILPKHDVSFFVEGEYTAALIDDFNGGAGPFSNPNVAGNTVIADPDNFELNQAYVQYKKNGFTAKVGRQRYILDNAAFVGNVGWRQNEQTLDAATVAYKGDDFWVSYAYANRVNRIFGVDADGVGQAFEGDIHLVNGWKNFGDVKVGAYGYFLDLDEASSNGLANNASSNTYGAYIKYNGFHGEYAIQEDGGDSTTGRGSTDYYHVWYGTKAGKVALKFGVESRDVNFATPLATVHAFEGWADRFLASRLGVPGTGPGFDDGLTDAYFVASTKVSDVSLKGIFHYFANRDLNQDIGWEVDFVATKPLFEGATLLTKLAYFNGDEADDEIVQATAQIDYAF